MLSFISKDLPPAHADSSCFCLEKSQQSLQHGCLHPSASRTGNRTSATGRMSSPEIQLGQCQRQTAFRQDVAAQAQGGQAHGASGASWSLRGAFVSKAAVARRAPGSRPKNGKAGRGRRGRGLFGFPSLRSVRPTPWLFASAL